MKDKMERNREKKSKTVAEYQFCLMPSVRVPNWHTVTTVAISYATRVLQNARQH